MSSFPLFKGLIQILNILMLLFGSLKPQLLHNVSPGLGPGLGPVDQLEH